MKTINLIVASLVLLLLTSCSNTSQNVGATVIKPVAADISSVNATSKECGEDCVSYFKVKTEANEVCSENKFELISLSKDVYKELYIKEMVLPDIKSTTEAKAKLPIITWKEFQPGYCLKPNTEYEFGILIYKDLNETISWTILGQTKFQNQSWTPKVSK